MPRVDPFHSDTTSDFYNPLELEVFHDQSQCGYGSSVRRDGQAKAGVGLNPRGYPRTLCRACDGIRQRGH
jgi:hypothetical protein